MIIQSIGPGARELECEKILKERFEWREGTSDIDRVIILPLPSTRDGVTVCGTDTALMTVADGVRRGTLVVGYGIPDTVTERILAVGAAVCDAARDERFTEDNARLTAWAALGYMLLDAGIAPEDLSVGIVGWGRIGSQLGAQLAFLGARLTVYTTAKDKRIELGRLGIRTADTLSEADFRGIDVLINTAPARAIPADAPGVSEILKIYDLASGSFTDHIDGVIKLPSLPTRYYTKSAAKRYAEYVVRMLDGRYARI